MSKIQWKPGAMLSPVPPVLVSCGDMENHNVLTVAWTGMLNTHPPMTYISLRPERHSYNIIKDTGEFVMNLATEKLVFAADYCGVHSGRHTDKFAKMNLTPEAASKISAPMIAESPLNIECEVREIVKLGSHDMFISEIVAVNVDESAFNSAGKLDFVKCGLLAYAHGEYFTLGKSLGGFGFSVKKKMKKKPNKRGGYPKTKNTKNVKNVKDIKKK
jgi:flavin reductase (DIM6/NTAB) family NADH-FMN oxidoreductase RutF